MGATEHCYIVTAEQILNGEALIKGTRTPVQATDGTAMTSRYHRPERQTSC
jgi:hypothetical protein